MEKATSKPRERYFRNAIIYFLTCCLVLNTSLPAVMALEAVDVISSSGATPTQWGDHTIINTDHGAIINWNNFNTSTGQSVSFNQFDGATLSNQSAVLNRISSGAVPTQFDGALNGNGRVFVVNPAGIIFGSGSTVNVGQLVASGLNMTDEAFNAAIADPASNMAFVGGTGQVENRGVISADKVFLIGRKVVNRYTIRAQNGLVVMAAGSNVYAAQDGSNVLVEFAGAVDGTPDIMNRSLIAAPNGKVVLAAGDTLSRAIYLSGIVSAQNGEVTARAAVIDSAGSISADGTGGNISLTGTEQVNIDYWNTTGTGFVTANAASTSDGGTIHLESQGTVNITANGSVQAAGGTLSGNGGTIRITAPNFTINGEVDASPGNTNYESGKLEINTPSITIANGANAGAANTIYEQDIETLSDKGTGLVVNSEQGITVPDIIDGEIKGRFGNFELHATNTDSFITFEDATDTISTTLGNIVMGAGSGGLTIGNLQTGKDVSDVNPTPGQIILSTSDRGAIKTGNLIVRDGWGHAEINVNASGELAVNGNVIVGADSPILNIPGGQDAEAMIFLKSGDNLLLGGDVTARAHGLNAGLEGGVTRAYIGIFSGTNETWYGNLTINGDLTATAISSSVGTSDATIEIDSWGTLTWGPDAADPVADGDSGQVHVASKQSGADTNEDGDTAKVVVNVQNNAPGILGVPDFATTHMGTAVEGNVLDNDASPSGEVLSLITVQGPSHAESFDLDGSGYYTYIPEPGYVGQDTFTYRATAPGEQTDPVLVTITITNNSPAAQAKLETGHMGAIFDGSLRDAISDPDGDSLTTALVTDALHGKVTMSVGGTYSYEPEAGYVGDDTFTFSATDGQIGAEPVTATVTITLTNSAPSAFADNAATAQSVPVVINVLANDTDPEGDSLKVVSFIYNGKGSININDNRTITYTSADDFVGQESFTYFATDGQIGGTPVASTVTVLVAPTAAVPPAYFMPTGPDLKKTDVDISGCPALTTWAADEVGVDRRRMQIWIVNGLASDRGIQPCEACTNLRRAATVLADSEGIYADAIGRIVEEFGSRTDPMTEEMAAYITNAMAADTGASTHYARAKQYFGALAMYMNTLHNEMGFSVEASARLVARKYIDPLADTGNIGVASYVAARVDSITTFLTVVRLSHARR